MSSTSIPHCRPPSASATSASVGMRSSRNSAPKRTPASSRVIACGAHRGNPAAPVGSAVDGRIMNHHDFAIASHPHVELTHIGAKLGGRDECAQGVFRIKSAGAPMGDRQHRRSRQRTSRTALIANEFTRRASRRANPCAPPLHRQFPHSSSRTMTLMLEDVPYA